MPLRCAGLARRVSAAYDALRRIDQCAVCWVRASTRRSNGTRENPCLVGGEEESASGARERMVRRSTAGRGGATQSQLVSVRIADRRHPARPALADGGSWTLAPRREALAFSLRDVFAVAGQPSQLPKIACFQQRAGDALQRSHFADRFYLPLHARRHWIEALVDLLQDHATHPVDRAFP